MASNGRRSASSIASLSSAGSGFGAVTEIEKYRLISNIGKGSFGVISKVQRLQDGKVRTPSGTLMSIDGKRNAGKSAETDIDSPQEYALKELDYGKMNERDRKQIMAEV